TAAVAATGTHALGVDISPVAVRLTRRRGGTALCRSVFQRLPAEGRWRHVLLADGNIGIGGDPVRLLTRCRSLLAPGGSVLVEVEPPGGGSGTSTVRLRHGERYSQPFRWARVAADDLAADAEPAALRPIESWTEDGRWFAALGVG
ncbi:MAG: class I SAM-dependent methyltransferase, partial [Actinocatenispora sp.]